MPSPPSGKRQSWAGVAVADRHEERRRLLLEAAFELFGTRGETGTSIRSVCALARLNMRYFYENFTDRDAMLAALYDQVAGELAERVAARVGTVSDQPTEALRTGIGTVLEFITEDSRRAKVLFTEATSNPVLSARRRVAVAALSEAVIDRGRELGAAGNASPALAKVTAAMFAGAMSELADEWASGQIDADLDTVVDDAVRLSIAIFGVGGTD